MARYRHKPTVVMAEKWFPDKPVAGVLFPIPDGEAPFEPDQTDGLLDDEERVLPGDWIVTDEDGFHTLYSVAEFEQWYEPV